MTLLQFVAYVKQLVAYFAASSVTVYFYDLKQLWTDTMDDLFGKRLARARASANMTQRELADVVGITWSQISRYEASKAKPRLAVLLKLADALGVKPEDLSGDRSDDDESNEITLMLTGNETKKIEGYAEEKGITFDEAVNQLIAAGMKDRMDKSPDLMAQLEAEIPGAYEKLLELLGGKSKS